MSGNSISRGRRGGRTTPRSRSWKQSRVRPIPVSQFQLKGGKIFVPGNPPDVTYQPWNQVTLVKIFTTSSTFQVKDFKSLIRSQIDPTKRGFNQKDTGDDQFMIQLKIHQIRAWNTIGRVISLSVTDYAESASASGNRNQLCGLVDTGSTTHTPCVGYRLPSSIQQIVIRPDAKQGDDVIFHCSGSTGDQIIVYIDILYRFDGPVIPPSLVQPIVSIASTSQQSLDYTTLMQRHLAVLERIQRKMDKEKPSIITKTVEGVVTAAQVVSMLAAESKDFLTNIPEHPTKKLDDDSISSESNDLERLSLDDL